MRKQSEDMLHENINKGQAEVSAASYHGSVPFPHPWGCCVSWANTLARLVAEDHQDSLQHAQQD